MLHVRNTNVIQQSNKQAMNKTATFQNQTLLSKPEREITEITNIQDTSYSILTAFSQKVAIQT